MDRETDSPQTTTSTNAGRRRHFRLACEIPVRYRTSSGTEGEATLVNIGMGGARVDLPAEVTLPADLDLEIPRDGGPLRVVGRVIWSVLDEEGGPVPTGVQFQQMDDGTRRGLYDLLTELDA
jgi:hypothetical protein